MLDKTLLKLSNDYLLHEIEFDEYRQQRSEYIDKVTGYVEHPSKENHPGNTDDRDDSSSPFQSSGIKKNAILILSLTTILFLILYSLFTLSNH